MSNLDEISTAIGALRADNETAKDDRAMLWRQLEEINKSIHGIQSSLDKLCAARGIERAIAAKIAGSIALVFSAASAAATKYWWN